jgi:peptidoglycan hydrolase-like protein with peptidoglycan-binding domain
MVELIGKLTGTPYWKCLQIEKTNPVMIEQAREWYDGMTPQDRIKLIQRKLTGMDLYSGPVNGVNSGDHGAAIGKFQAENGLIADGRVNFDLYYALLDADQPIAADPTAKPVAATVAPSAPRGPMTLKLDSEKGGRYRVKDALGAHVQLSNDGVLYCYYKDVSGAIARIYPNRFSPDPFIKAGRAMSLPPETSPFKIKFDQAGREQISCYASDRDMVLPANLKAADLTPLKVGSMDEIAAAFRKSNPAVAEAKLDLVIQ